MPLIIPSNTITGGYEVANSLRFNSGSSDYLSRTYGTPTNNLKYTKSFWIKRSGLTDIAKGFVFNNSTRSNTDSFYFSASDQIVLGNVITPNTGTVVFRDVSAWYHCVMVFDSANATADDRLILYVNGIRQTLSSTISLNSTGGNQSGVTYEIGHQGGLSRYLDGYLAEICMIDGQALDPTSFGEFDADTGIWKPIDVSGLTFGNNGFYLPFENSAALGQDDSGNGNNFTVNNLTSIDQTTDTPTNNFATFNPLIKSPSSPTLSEGNLKTATGTTGTFGGMSTLGVSQGKWYAEFKYITDSADNRGNVAITRDLNPYQNSNTGFGNDTASLEYRAVDGKTRTNSVNSTYGSTWTQNDIIGVALDLDNGYVYFSKNGVWQNSGDPESGASGTGGLSDSISIGEFHFIGCGDDTGTYSEVLAANYGNPPYTISSGNSDANGYGNFEYAVPSGYYALNTKNLAEYG